jgi:hypothetical protein
MYKRKIEKYLKNIDPDHIDLLLRIGCTPFLYVSREFYSGKFYLEGAGLHIYLEDITERRRSNLTKLSIDANKCILKKCRNNHQRSRLCKISGLIFDSPK